MRLTKWSVNRKTNKVFSAPLIFIICQIHIVKHNLGTYNSTQLLFLLFKRAINIHSVNQKWYFYNKTRDVCIYFHPSINFNYIYVILILYSSDNRSVGPGDKCLKMFILKVWSNLSITYNNKVPKIYLAKEEIPI